MFSMQIPFLDLDQVYNSGQVFRWIKFRDGKYAIPYGDSCVKVEQVHNVQGDRFLFSCDEKEFFEKWYEYFDIGSDYMSMNYDIRLMDEDFRAKAVRAKGIRILQQDLFEVIITFMLATATTMSNVKRMLGEIASKCGNMHKQSMREVGVVKWYEFPTYDMILDKQKRLSDNFGLKRKENILSLCKDIDAGWIDIYDMYNMSYREAREFLLNIEGIGPKVADCICLYGLHMMESFPIDTHIKQIIARDFGCDSFEGFNDWYLTDLQECRGLVQQYMFYNEVHPPVNFER